MKIAYLSTFYPFRGGIAQFNASLLRSLSKYCEVRAFNFKRQYPKLLFPGKSQFVDKNDKVEAIETYQVLDTINPLSYFSTARKIKSYQPDIVITKYWMPFFAPSLGTVLKLLKKHTFNIAILDNVDPHEKFPFAQILNKYFIQQNHSFVVMSNKVLKDLLKIKPKANFILVQHPLYDHFGTQIEKEKARDILSLPKNRKILLFFGFIREYKGLDILLEAISLLPEEFFLVVAGESYISMDNYLEMIEKNNLQSKVKMFVRYISDNEVPLFFSAADVCVLPYKSATQSGIVGIAYHFELPVVATRVGGLHEMIEPFGTGIMVDKPDPNELAQKILQFFEHPLEKFKKGIDKYKSIANWDFLATKIIHEYNFFKGKRE
ncbi:MAG: glycosyltransferase [Ignavibacteria bacterium]|nr:glycosyltransferase [Ignavibacteria bacterium]